MTDDIFVVNRTNYNKNVNRPPAFNKLIRVSLLTDIERREMLFLDIIKFNCLTTQFNIFVTRAIADSTLTLDWPLKGRRSLRAAEH